jgi:hypothetical protein
MSSSIEERLARDIAALTGGVIVTDSELLEAGRAVADRIDSERRRARMRRFAPAAAAAVVLVLLSATAYLTLGGDDHASLPGGGGPIVSDPESEYLTGTEPTAAILDGLWRLDNGHIMVKFTKDGTVRIDGNGTVFSHPATTGTYVIDGDVITVTTTQSAQRSCVGTTFAMRASVPATGALRYVPQMPGGTCSPMPPGRGAFEQVLPTKNKDMASLVFSTDAGWQALSDKATLYGVWLAERGGYLLEMDRDGSYYVADVSGEPVDRGTWSLRSSDLTLTSSAKSVRCSAGDRLVLGNAEQEDPGTTAIRGTVRLNTCSAAWTPAAWLLIPHVGS